jgi:hypothetical protein
MGWIDVFNGDADGICALQQLRLDDPRESILVTGVKRDIALLARAGAVAGDQVTALDISLDKNRDALVQILAAGARVRYFDHHFAGDLPEHPALELHIETVPDRGTSLLVDDYLQGRYRAWAVVGTFGDNFDDSARRAAEPLGLSEHQLGLLRDLGIYINYNGYGSRIEDLHFPPDILYRKLSPYSDPLELIADDDIFSALRDGYAEDMARGKAVSPELEDGRHALYVLPAEPWARRVGGVLANALACAAPERAHALMTRLPAGGFVVSVRAPLSTKEGADTLCRRFPSGGGRKAAAGINDLPESAYDDFVRAFLQAF